MADVVVAEVRRRVPQQDRARAVVKARRDPELTERGPHGIVAVLAVDADGVVPFDELRRVRVLLHEGGNRTADEAAQHHHAEAELLAGELDGGRNDAIAVGAELLGRERVVENSQHQHPPAAIAPLLGPVPAT
jgi:hypothetical protein